MYHKVAYFLGSDLIGEVEVASKFPPLSFAFFCSTCGDVWGRAVCLSSRPMKCLEVPCERHLPVGVWDWGEIPGSMIQAVDSRMVGSGRQPLCLDILPESLLQREFQIHLAHAERQEKEIE